MCGLSGILPVKSPAESRDHIDAAYLDVLKEWVGRMETLTGAALDDGGESHLGGQELLESLWGRVRTMKRDLQFYDIHAQPAVQKDLKALSERMTRLVTSESRWLTDHVGRLAPEDVEVATSHIDQLRDMAWSVDKEVLENLRKIDALLGKPGDVPEVAIFEAIFPEGDRNDLVGKDFLPALCLKDQAGSAEVNAIEHAEHHGV